MADSCRGVPWLAAHRIVHREGLLCVVCVCLCVCLCVSVSVSVCVCDRERERERVRERERERELVCELLYVLAENLYSNTLEYAIRCQRSNYVFK